MTEPKKPAVIVALPHPADPVHGIGPEESHVTLLYLGNVGDIDPEQINTEIADSLKGMSGPMSDAVSGEGTLGPDRVNVLLMDGHHLGGIRDKLLDKPGIRAAHQAATQHPTWVPHLTLGYPGQGQNAASTITAFELSGKLAKPTQVTFDRVALWHGEDRTEHPIGKKDEMTEANIAIGTQAAAVGEGAVAIGDVLTEEQLALVAAGGFGAPSAIPWHGVLTTEGHKSGDRRSFKAGSLRTRNLPLPLTWQKVSDQGHRGSVKIARIDSITRVPIEDGKNEIRAHGLMMPADENADKVVGEMAFFGRIGVSVDVDDSTFEVTEATDEGGRPHVEFTDARVSSACAVIIPAFQEAWLQLGEPPEGFMDGGTSTEAAEADESDAAVAAELAEQFAPVSDKDWDGSASRFTDEQYARSCVLDRGADAGPAKQRYSLPIREPSGTLNRRAVHNAASRLSSVSASDAAKSAAKSKLRGAYRQMGETPPFDASDIDALTLPDELAEQLARGPGWVTNPEATKRIHSYWTTPGQPGYAKIAWGTPGDYERCVREIGQERSEKDPEGTARFIHAQCAQWQHDAIGVWPGRGEKLSDEQADVEAPTVALVASVDVTKWPTPKFAKFTNPNLSGITPIQFIEEDGVTYVHGHFSDKTECHLDFPGICITPPPLTDNGMRFMCGSVETDQGRIATGCLTLGGGHADTQLGWLAAKEHYDDVTTAVADVCVGEDEFGHWFAGVLRPWVTDEQRYQLYAGKLSGDWRMVGGEMTLIAAHAVNTPGFLVSQTRVKDGEQLALVAAGGVQRAADDPARVAAVVAGAFPEAAAEGRITLTVNGKPFEAVETFRTGPPPDLSQVVEEGIRRYKESEQASARLEKVAEAAGMTPTQRLSRLREQAEKGSS